MFSIVRTMTFSVSFPLKYSHGDFNWSRKLDIQKSNILYIIKIQYAVTIMDIICLKVIQNNRSMTSSNFIIGRMSFSSTITLISLI